MTEFLRSRAGVLLLEAAVLIASVADLLAADRPGWTPGFLVSALAVLVLLVRSRYPVTAMVLTLPAVLFGYALVAQLVTTFSVAHRGRRRRTVAVMLVAVAVAQAVNLFWVDDSAAPTDYNAQRVVFAVLIVLGPAALGLLLRAFDHQRDQLEQIRAGQRREAQLLERTVLTRERTRLAREMHDVVSHQVSLIAVQAGALRVTAVDVRSRETASTLRGLAVTCLDELRQMVSVLRESGPVPADELTPQPALADVPALVGASGPGVGLRLGPLSAEWSPAVQRAAYRTVQEGLTNVRKHAPGSSAAVEVSDEDGVLRVTVFNRAAPNAAHTSRAPDGDGLPGGGHGLVGLRERAELLDGVLQHGPVPGGGFRLELVVPAHRSAPGDLRSVQPAPAHGG